MKSRRLPFSFKGGKAVFIAYVPGFKGKARKKETHSGITVEEAWRRYAAFIDRVKGARTPGAITFAAFIEAHWTDIIGAWGETQVKNNWYLVGRRLLPSLGHLPLSAIRDAELQAFVSEMKRSGLGPTYINNLTKLLRSILGKAVTHRHLDAMPFRERPVLRETRLKQELSRAEMGAFLRAFHDREAFMAHLGEQGRVSQLTSETGTSYARRTMGLRPGSDAAEEAFLRFERTGLFFTLALECGVRKSDLLAMMFDAANTDDGWLVFTQRKTGEEVFVALTDAATAAIETLRSISKGKRMFGWLSEMTLRRHFAVAKAIAGIDRPFRIHDCRHTFGSRLASAGTPLQLIAKALGHTDTRMAEKRYARPSKEALRAVRDGLERQAPTYKSGPGGAAQLRTPSGSSEPTR